MTIHMIDAILRVVLDHKDCHLLPENRFESASTIWPSARSLSATIALGVETPGRVPTVWSVQLEECEVRHIPHLLPLLQVGEKNLRAGHIRDSVGEAGKVVRHNLVQRRNG